MKPPARVRVQRHHIDNGARKDGFACPIALAIQEQGGYELGEVSVAGGLAIWPTGESFTSAWTASLTQDAADFIKNFDRGRFVAPFEFDVEWIDQDGVGA